MIRTSADLWTLPDTDPDRVRQQLARYEAELRWLQRVATFLPPWLVAFTPLVLGMLAMPTATQLFSLALAAVLPLTPRLWGVYLQRRHAQLVKQLENGRYTYEFAWKSDQPYRVLCKALGREPAKAGNEGQNAAEYFASSRQELQALRNNPWDPVVREEVAYLADNTAKLIRGAANATPA